MNFKMILMIAAIAIPSLLFAQKDILTSEVDKEMSQGVKNSYVTLIPQAKGKDVTSDWKKYIKKDSKGKVDENNGEIFIIGGTIKNVSNQPLNIYARVLETTEGVQLTVWISEGGVFLSSVGNPDKSVAIQKYLHDFGVQQYKDAVKQQLEAEQKKQKELEKVYEGFVKDQKKAESNIISHNKDIEKLQNKIKEENENIQKAQVNQSTARADADKQKANVQQVNDMINNIK